MNDIIIIVVSTLYIFAVLGLATLVAKRQKRKTELSRKLVHILVGNWVFFTPFFSSLWAVLVVPFSFIIINALSMRYQIFSAMEREDKNFGTVYYAVSMFILCGASYLLGWRELAFIGLLSMAYGDGLAALVGKRWGKRGRFSFAPEKTLAGSITTGVCVFAVSLGSIFFLVQAQLDRPAWYALLVVPALTAVFASFIELSGKNGCDNLSLPLGAGLFASLTLRFADVFFFIYCLLALIVLLAAYRFKSITVNGMVAALLTAVTLYALGGAWVGVSLLLFFIMGSGISKIKNENKKRAEERQESSGARNWKQVIANSLPACILLWVSMLMPHKEIYILLSFGVFSAAAADTFSSEIGMLGSGKVVSILTGKPVAKGVSGGVSLLGFAAAIVGSALLAIPAGIQYGIWGYMFVAVLGVLGCVIDSVIGASFQRRFLHADGELKDAPVYPKQKPDAGLSWVSNNAVNLISLFTVSFIGLFLSLFL